MSAVGVLGQEFADYTSPFCINKTHSSNKKKVHADLRVKSTARAKLSAMNHPTAKAHCDSAS